MAIWAAQSIQPRAAKPRGLLLPMSCLRIRPRLWAAAASEYLLRTLSIPVSQLRRLPPVSQRWAKLRSTTSLRRRCKAFPWSREQRSRL